MTTTLADLGGAAGVLERLLDGVSLSLEESQVVMDHVFDGEADPAVIAGLLIALRAKGETADELTGMVRSMLSHAAPLTVNRPVMDIVGTGGDQKHSVNISTMSALVVAGAGVAVCKHGNRAASSSVGTADVLEALDVGIEASEAMILASIERAGIGFCFAPAFHPAMRFVGPVRRALRVRTAFNFIGPLSNPARPQRMLIGTADPASAERMAMVLGTNGIERAWIVHSEDGYDELSLNALNRVVEVVGDGNGEFELSSWKLDPASTGLKAIDESAIRGGDVAYNAQVVRALLAGKTGPIRDLVALNAAAALVIAGAADSIESGIVAAGESLDSGAASTALDELVLATH